MLIDDVHIGDCGISFDVIDRVGDKAFLWFETEGELRDFIVELKQILTTDDEKETK